MKMKIELEVMDLLILYYLLLEANEDLMAKKKKDFFAHSFIEAFNKMDREISKQYTEEVGEYFERMHNLKKILYEKNKN